MLTRRAFVASTSATLLAQALPPAPTTRPNIAAIDHDRILAAAAVETAPPATRQAPDSAAFLAFTLSLPGLAAAALIDPANGARYTATASAQLQAWFVTPETRLPTSPEYKSFEPIVDLSPLAETSVALPFLGLDAALLDAVKQWFADYLKWLTESRTALLARDAKSHHGSGWLLQAAAFARATGNEAIMAECKHRFKTVTVRAQIDANGYFQHELTTENPYRNSLWNLDLMAGVCNLLSTQFESLWDHELQDGPGMRSAIARHAFYIKSREKWPFPADAAHFKLLPCRRPALVFAGRAYQQAEYVSIWRTLNPDPTEPDILRAFPIRQPILWVTQPKPQLQ
jgi:hypothetical protein